MIASLHPCITKDINILCAGRSLTTREKNRLKKARAVIVPQGVTAGVYRECRRLVPHVFPNYDLRFPLEGKIGDSLLFQYHQVPHPRTIIFENQAALFENYPDLEILPTLLSGYPIVLKADRGGEGAFVFLVHSQQELLNYLDLLPKGQSGSEGFVLQERIDHGGKDLRVVVLGDELLRLLAPSVKSGNLFDQPEPGGDHRFGRGCLAKGTGRRGGQGLLSPKRDQSGRFRPHL